MTPNEVQNRITQLLQGSDGLSASNLAKILKLTKTEINSNLYKGKGRIYVSEGDSPPIWRVFGSGSKVTPAAKQKYLTRKIDGQIHIDFAGGDWELEIGMADLSRNDPIAVVERLGERKRLILVSHQVVSEEETKLFEEHKKVPDAAIAIASSVLVWEIFQSLDLLEPDGFDFEKSISEVFLSISAHARLSN
jgi:hypothetical protein